jgi:hypothetical protein
MSKAHFFKKNPFVHSNNNGNTTMNRPENKKLSMTMVGLAIWAVSLQAQEIWQHMVVPEKTAEATCEHPVAAKVSFLASIEGEMVLYARALHYDTLQIDETKAVFPVPSRYLVVALDAMTGRKIWEQEINADGRLSAITNDGRTILLVADRLNEKGMHIKTTLHCLAKKPGGSLWHSTFTHDLAFRQQMPGSDLLMLSMQQDLDSISHQHRHSAIHSQTGKSVWSIADTSENPMIRPVMSKSYCRRFPGLEPSPTSG